MAAPVQQPLQVAPAPALPPLDADAGDAFTRTPVFLYDELATIFEQHSSDCAQMGQASLAALLHHKPRMERWAEALTKLSAAQVAEQEALVKEKDGPRMERFRDRLADALRACSVELMPVLTELSQYGIDRAQAR